MQAKMNLDIISASCLSQIAIAGPVLVSGSGVTSISAGHVCTSVRCNQYIALWLRQGV